MTADLSTVPASRPAVFLDRDGVLNAAYVRDGKPFPPRNLAEFRLLPGVIEACQSLDSMGYLLVVITNQPDIARGSQTLDQVQLMHSFLLNRLPLTEIVICPHDDTDDCRCRKPKPGMLLEAANRLHIDLTRSFCVGDRWRDIEAARRAGVRGIHVACEYDEQQVVGADAVVSSLEAAIPFIRSMHGAQGDFSE